MVRKFNEISLEKKIAIFVGIISAIVMPFNLLFRLAIAIFMGISYLLLYIFGMYCVGWTPDYRARELSEEEKILVSKNGLVHYTRPEFAECIINDDHIKKSKRCPSYSMHFKRSVFFYIIGETSPNKQKFLECHKDLRVQVIIKDLTQDQINKLRIRRYDNAIMFPGDFYFLDTNSISVAEEVQTAKEAYN